MSTYYSKAFFGPANRRAAGSLWKVLKLASTGHVPAGPVGEKYRLVMLGQGEEGVGGRDGCDCEK